jgi:hypothetical protein
VSPRLLHQRHIPSPVQQQLRAVGMHQVIAAGRRKFGTDHRGFPIAVGVRKSPTSSRMATTVDDLWALDGHGENLSARPEDGPPGEGSR